MPGAGSRDRAVVTAQLGCDPNVSGKFPVSSTSAQHRHAFFSQKGLGPTSGLYVPSIPPAGDLPGALTHLCHCRVNCWHGELKASSHLPCFSFPVEKIPL